MNAKHRSILVTIVAVASFGIALGSAPAAGTAGGHTNGIDQQKSQRNPNPQVVPPRAEIYEDLSERWWIWAYSFLFAEIPFFNTGGAVDLSAGQSGNVWFLAGANSGLTSPRTGNVPAGKSLFFPIANLINDWPCPDPNFKPAPGESLEHFLQVTGNDALPHFTDAELSAEIDGRSLQHLSIYRITSDLFMFQADAAAAGFDPCITGTQQFGVSIGYYLLLTPLTPGQHTIHFAAPGWGQDVTYVLTVGPQH